MNKRCKCSRKWSSQDRYSSKLKTQIYRGSPLKSKDLRRQQRFERILYHRLSVQRSLWRMECQAITIWLALNHRRQSQGKVHRIWVNKEISFHLSRRGQTNQAALWVEKILKLYPYHQSHPPANHHWLIRLQKISRNVLMLQKLSLIYSREIDLQKV